MQPDFNPDSNPFEAIMNGLGGGQASQGQAPQGAPAPQGQGGQGLAGQIPPELLAQLAQQGGGQPGGTPPAQPGQPALPQGAGLPPMPDVEQPVTYPGSNPGGSKHLISAMQSLQKFITESTDDQEIHAARILTSILGKLIDRDQQNQESKEQSAQGGMPGMPPEAGGAPQGEPQMPQFDTGSAALPQGMMG